MRLQEFLDRYLEVHLEVKDPKSWEKELGRLRRIRAHFGDPWVDEIHTVDIEEFLASLRYQGFKPATVNRYYARLSSIMKKARAWGYRTDDPLKYVDRLKEQPLGDRCHDLRHHAASQMVMADVPLGKVAKILGHKLLETTQRYAHLADESLFEAVERIVTKKPGDRR